MGGVTTDICLIFPSISAVQEGFNVSAVLDASSYEVQEDMGVQVLTTTNTAIAELVQDWSTPQGSELIQLLMATVPKARAAH
jgi:nicotinamidase-related amidase